MTPIDRQHIFELAMEELILKLQAPNALASHCVREAEQIAEVKLSKADNELIQAKLVRAVTLVKDSFHI